MLPLRHLVLVVASLSSGFAETAQVAADRDRLLSGVSHITAPGVPGSVCAFGPQTFAVVAGKEGRSGQSAVIGAGIWEKGRIVAFGHDGYLSATSDPGTAQLLLNAVRWTGEKRGSLKVVVRGPSELLAHLRANGMNASAAKDQSWTATLKDAHVLCLDARRLRAGDEVSEVAKWVRGGGGLIIAGTGWGWASLNKEKNLANDFPANQLLASAGIVFGSGTPGKTAEGGYSTVAADVESLNASSALDALLHQTDRHLPANLNQMSAIVSEAIRSLPVNDTILLPRLNALRTAGANTFPVPTKPIASTHATARLLLTMDVQELKAKSAQQLRAHPAADAFPGRIPADAPRLQKQILKIDTSIRDWHSTGLYAPPGEPISVTIPSSARAGGLSVRIGCHSDKLWHHDQWQRVPEITTAENLQDGTTITANSFGGLIYIVVPRGCSLGSVEVSISGAVQAPRFALGETSLDAWRQKLRQAPAPWAELQTRKIILTLPSSAIRNLDDPEAVLRFWDSALDAVADLAGISHERERPERIVTDVQISAGYMHSGYPIMTHLDVAERMVSVDRLKAGGWGFWHELGHNHQAPEWTFSGTGEVTCNLFSLYICEKLCGIAPGQGHDAMAPGKVAPRLAKHLATRAVFKRWQEDPFLALTMYDQLREAFGWETYRRVFAEYRHLRSEERPKSDDEKRDQWMVRFSRATGKNLGAFFEAWGVPTSEKARKSIAHLPGWMPANWPTQ